MLRTNSKSSWLSSFVAGFFYIFMLFLLKIILYLPYPLLKVLANFFALLRSMFSSKEKKLLHNNMNHILELRPNTTFGKMFERQVFRHQIICAFETLLEIQRPGSIKWHGFDELKSLIQRLEEQEGGQVLITAHLGSWELVGMMAAKASRRTFYALAKPARFAFITKALAKIRKIMNMDILWTGSLKIQREMLSALKQNSWLGFVMDQKPQGRVGPEVMFWGRKTEFVAGPGQMALRAQRPVIAVYCVRIAKLEYKIISEELLPRGHGVTDLVELSQLFAKSIEQAIRLYPEQWCWNYKRWRFDKHS